MKKLIHDAVYRSLTEVPERNKGDLLYVSDLGRNPYAAIRRIMTGEVEQFDYPTLMKMDGGNALEAFTLRQVAENLTRPIRTQFPLFNDVWVGYPDLVIGHGTEDVIICDHKGSCGKWWDYKESLPRSADCCQVWMYGQLYYEKYGVRPRLGLYYRGWGTWAEFEIIFTASFGSFEAKGVITDGKGLVEAEVVRQRDVDPFLLAQELVKLRERALNGKLTEEDLAKMAPNGPDWNYAEDATARIRTSGLI